MPTEKLAELRHQVRLLSGLGKRHIDVVVQEDDEAHLGLGRIIQPVEDQMQAVGQMLGDPAFAHVCFDISWDEVAKYAVASGTSIQRVSDALNRYPDRFLFGTDTVAPRDGKAYFGVYHMWDPVWSRLTPGTKAKVTKGNYERLFDAARVKVRAWEKANAK